MNLVEFGSQLRQLRRDFGLSGNALADLIYDVSEGVIHVDSSSISRIENGQRRSIQRDLLLVLGKIFADLLEPVSLQQWASYTGYRLTTAELEEIFGDRYPNYAKYILPHEIWADADQLATALEKINLDLSFQQRMTVVYMAYQEMFLQSIGLLIKTKKPEISTYRKTKLELERNADWAPVFTNYWSDRNQKMMHLATITILSTLLSILVDAIVTSPYLTIILVITQLIWVMVIFYQYAAIVAPELVYTGQLEKQH